jgi:hypothetical protein
MVIIHKLLKRRSIRALNSTLLATTCVFLAAKVRSCPFSLVSAASALFMLEAEVGLHGARRGAGGAQPAVVFTKQREAHYMKLIEEEEHRILGAIAFDLSGCEEEELPYTHINAFCA